MALIFVLVDVFNSITSIPSNLQTSKWNSFIILFIYFLSYCSFTCLNLALYYENAAKQTIWHFCDQKFQVYFISSIAVLAKCTQGCCKVPSFLIFCWGIFCPDWENGHRSGHMGAERKFKKITNIQNREKVQTLFFCLASEIFSMLLKPCREYFSVRNFYRPNLQFYFRPAEQQT